MIALHFTVKNLIVKFTKYLGNGWTKIVDILSKPVCFSILKQSGPYLLLIFWSWSYLDKSRNLQTNNENNSDYSFTLGPIDLEQVPVILHEIIHSPI